MKKIMAGEGFCSAGKFVSPCLCGIGGSGGTYCVPADGNTPAHACNDWCLLNHCLNGTADNTACVTSCP